MILKQKQGLRRRIFEIKNDTVYVKHQSFSETKEWNIKLENLGTQTYIEAKSKIGKRIVSIFLFIFAIYIFYNQANNKNVTIWEMTAVVSFYLMIPIIVYLIPVKREIHLIGGQSGISFFLDNPSREEIQKFIDVLIDRSKKILIEKYGKIDPDLPEETMMNQLNWLKNQNIITAEKYEVLKKEYKTKKLFN